MVDYAEHLKSSYWRNLKRRRLNIAGRKCERCGWEILGPHQSHLHHKTYERLGHEDIEDVELLCVSCHEEEHDPPAVSQWEIRQEAYQAVRREDWLRNWPTAADTRAMDDRAQQVGRTLARAPDHDREAAFSKLWWFRFRHEPVIADLVRVGVALEEAELRMDRRLARFQRAFRGGG